MVEGILALSWGTIFWFGIKAISAWVLATIAVFLAAAIPIMLVIAIAGGIYNLFTKG